MWYMRNKAQWDTTLTKASVSQSARHFRALFYIVIKCCDPLGHSDKHKDILTEITNTNYKCTYQILRFLTMMNCTIKH